MKKKKRKTNWTSPMVLECLYTMYAPSTTIRWVTKDLLEQILYFVTDTLLHVLIYNFAHLLKVFS